MKITKEYCDRCGKEEKPGSLLFEITLLDFSPSRYTTYAICESCYAGIGIYLKNLKSSS